MPYFLILLLLIFTASARATEAKHQLFIEPDAGRAPLLASIHRAQHEIDLTMYLFTDKTLAQALKKAAARGVVVKMLIEKEPFEAQHANQWLPRFLNHSTIQWQWVPFPSQALAFYHQKTFIVDHQKAWVMTMNFTKRSFDQTAHVRNFLVEDQDSSEVHALDNLFQKEWEHTPIIQVSQPTIMITPLNGRAALTNLIDKSQHHIELYADALTDYDLIGRLAKASDRGVQVRVIYHTLLNNQAKAYLARHHIETHQSLEGDHAKALSIDDKRLYIGSANFTQNSLDNNREAGLFLSDSTVLNTFKAQFEKDWK